MFAANVLIAFLIGTVIIVLCVFALFKFNSKRTKKRADTREKNNTWYKIKRRMINGTLFGVIEGAIIGEFACVGVYQEAGGWMIAQFVWPIIGIAITNMYLFVLLGPLYDRIKRNLLVRHQDRSVISILRIAWKILLIIAPFVIFFIMGKMGLSKEVVGPLVFFGASISVIIGIVFWKIRNSKIEKGIREGCKKFANYEKVARNRITQQEIIDCITCDSVEMDINFVIKHDLSDVGFSCVDFKTIVGKRGASATDPAEAIHYKLAKHAKSPIICTFDEEITDSPLPIVETENPAFNNEFTTYCQNAEDAFYILTPTIMEQMLEAQRIYKRLVFNFDGDNLFIIVYHNKFKETLAKGDVDAAFNGINNMLGYLIFDSICKEGYHTEKARKPKDEVLEAKKAEAEVKQSASSSRFKKGLKIGAIIVGFILVGNIFFFGLSMCAFNESITRDMSSGTSSAASTEDITKIQTYLKQKYGQDFIVPQNAYFSKYENNYSTRVSGNFVDANGYSFYAESYIWHNESEELKFSDDYQSSQYDKIIFQQILSTNPNIDDIYYASGPFTEKFSSIEDMLNMKTNMYISIYLKDSFGEINADTALDLSKKIVAATKIQDAYFNYYIENDRQKQCAYRYQNGEYYIS